MKPIAVQAMPTNISTGHQTVSVPGSPIKAGSESGRPAAISTSPATILWPGLSSCDRLGESLFLLRMYFMQCIERPSVAAAN